MAAVWVALASGAPVLAASASPALGQAAPVLVGPSFSGGLFDLSAMHGKVVVLNFWASWCEPCRREMPVLEALSHDYRDRVVVVGLSADDRHDRKDALSVARTVSYMTGLLAEARTNGFGMPAVLPLTYIIGPTGRVSAILRANQGPLSNTQLRAAVDAALGTSAGR